MVGQWRTPAVLKSRYGRCRSSWRERVGRVRRDSTVNLLISVLPSTPVFTTTTASELVIRSFPADKPWQSSRLVAAGVLVQVSVGRRNRAYEAPELIDAFTAFERKLASPEADTRVYQFPLVEYLGIRERKPDVLRSAWSETPPISKL